MLAWRSLAVWLIEFIKEFATFWIEKPGTGIEAKETVIAGI
jgi:hypothetical protein